jgi:hypothetical protein
MAVAINDAGRVDLPDDAVAAYEQRRDGFFDLANRFQKSTYPAETERLREELARMTFGARCRRSGGWTFRF